MLTDFQLSCGRVRWLTVAVVLAGWQTPVHAQAAAEAEAAPATVSTSPAQLTVPPAAEAATSTDIPTTSAEGDIIVTAQRRAEPLQRVPISITVFDGAALAKGHITDARSLAVVTPGLQISGAYQFSKPVFAIRGISFKSFNATDQQAVGVYQDEVFIASRSGQLAQMFDLSSVEVLRGPQGILYGKNTTGGAINFNSRQPGSTFEADMTGTLGAFWQRGIQGGVTLPVGDRLSVRVAGTFDRRKGLEYDENAGRDTYGYMTYGGRAIARFEASDALVLIANLHGSYTRGTPNFFYNRGVIPTADGRLGDISGFVASDDFYTISTNLTDQREIIKTRGAQLRAELDLGGATLTSISAYERTKYSTFEDTDASPVDIATVDYYDKSRQYSQELRLASKNDSPLSWLAGLYFFDERLASRTVTVFFGGTSDQSYTQKTTDYAAFGQLSYQLTERLSLIAGARYTYERKSIDLLTIDNGVYNFSGAPVTLVDASTARTFKAPTFKAGINFQIDRTKLLYASFNRGFKTGGFNGTVFVPGEFTTVKPEYVNAYEVGLKSSWLDNALLVNLAGFYNDYNDLQVFNFVDGVVPVTQVVNAASARSYGLEFDLVLRPVKRLRLEIAGTLLDARIRSVNVANLAALAGNRLPLAPHLNVTASAEYGIPLNADWTITSRAELVHTGHQFFDNNEDPLSSQKAYQIANGYLSLENRRLGWTISVFGKNLFDTHYLTDSIPFLVTGMYYTKHGERPTYGLSVRKTF